MTDIFLSYARPDKAAAQKVAERLIAAGWDVWWDPELLPHVSYREAIDQQLAKCRCIVVLWSKNSRSSSWVLSEASTGLDNRKLVQIGLDDERPPRPFDQWQTANISTRLGEQETERQWRGVFASVTILAGAAPAVAEDGVATPPPVARERPAPRAVQPAAVPPAPAEARTEHVAPAVQISQRTLVIGGLVLAALVAGGSLVAVLAGRPPGPVAVAATPLQGAHAPPTAQEKEDNSGFTIIRPVPGDDRPLVWDGETWLQGGLEVTTEDGQRTIEAGGKSWPLKPNDAFVEETGVWNLACELGDIGSPEGLLSYLEKYPSGTYEREARDRIEAIDHALCAKLARKEIAAADYFQAFSNGTCAAAVGKPH